MGLLSRINDIVRSNLNDLLSKAENPEKLLNQAILDMENHLRKARKQVVDTIASEKTMEKKRLAVIESAARWERRAATALHSGDEELARLAIVRKNDQERHAQTLEEQVRVQREYVGALKQGLVSLEERHREARAKKQSLIARAQAARIRKKTVERLVPEATTSSSPESRAFDTFDRMEDKILALEAQAEATLELAQHEGNGKDDVRLEARFAALEQADGIESQLERLKKQVKGKTAPKG